MRKYFIAPIVALAAAGFARPGLTQEESPPTPQPQLNSPESAQPVENEAAEEASAAQQLAAEGQASAEQEAAVEENAQQQQNAEQQADEEQEQAQQEQRQAAEEQEQAEEEQQAQDQKEDQEGEADLEAQNDDDRRFSEADRNARWRFVNRDGVWWYRTPQRNWMYYQGGDWNAFRGDGYAGGQEWASGYRGAQQQTYADGSYNAEQGYVDNGAQRGAVRHSAGYGDRSYSDYGDSSNQTGATEWMCIDGRWRQVTVVSSSEGQTSDQSSATNDYDYDSQDQNGDRSDAAQLSASESDATYSNRNAEASRDQQSMGPPPIPEQERLATSPSATGGAALQGGSDGFNEDKFGGPSEGLNEVDSLGGDAAPERR